MMSPFRKLPTALLLTLPALVLAGCDSGDAPDTVPSPQAGDTPAAGATAGSEAVAVDPLQRFPFTDVTPAAGVRFTHDNGSAGRHHYLETMGPGAALFDADGDGDLDLYVVNGGPLPGTPTRRAVNRLYRNAGDGTFEDVTDGSGADDAGYGMGVTVGDVEGDGDLDLYVLNYGPNALYRNRGDGTFEKVASGAEDPTWSVSGAFFDADADGDLDLYVANYLVYDVEVEEPCKAGTLQIYCSPEQYPPTADRLYRNDGQGRFTDISEAAGVVRDGRGMGVAASDLDGDGDQDLYVTNDRSYNLLYVNEGDRLQESAVESGVGYGPTGLVEGGMGVVAADLADTGQPAIFLTNFQKEPNRLYAPVGDGFYDDLAFRAGVGFPSSEMIGWGIGAFDLEGDGDVDLTVANGHVFDNAAEFIPGSSWALPDQLYLNEAEAGTPRFSTQPFPGTAHSSRGLTWGDVDGDGDADLVVAACGGPATVWRNDAGLPARFLLLRLRSTAPNPRAVGARVRATAGGKTRMHEITGGGSYASAHDDRLYVGLGDGGTAERLEVRWPDGTVEELTDLSGGREVVWQQGQGIVAERPLEIGSALPETGGRP